MSATLGMIAGRVVGAGGEPVSGATVAAVGGAQPHHDIAAITSSDGTFRFGSILPGLYRVEARASGNVRFTDVAVTPGGRAMVEIQLAATVPAGPEDHRPFPVDLRQRVPDYHEYPWRCICSLLVTAANGVQRLATGWLAARRLVVTAGHVLYLHDEGGWATQVRVIPGRNGTDFPFGSALRGAADLRSVAGWTDNEDPDFDYGAIALAPEQSFGDTLGWLGFTPREDAEVASSTLNLSGYPADGGPTQEDGTQWLSAGLALDVGPRQLRYAIRTDPGEDGAPVWMADADGTPYCVAIHTWATRFGRGGVRVNAEVSDRIAQWAAQAA